MILKKNGNLSIINLYSFLSLSSMPVDPTISPEKREQLQQLFVRGNEQMSKRNYEYADNIYLTECVLQDPGNPIYAQTFLANLRKKFGDKKKKTTSLLTAGKKMMGDAKRPENLFKTSIETLKSNPWDIETLISAGKACEDLGHTGTAIIYYQTAVDADCTHVGANTAYSEILRETADYDGALVCLHRILKQRPDDMDLRRLMKDILADKTIHQGKYAAGVSRDTLESSGTVVSENEDVMGRSLTVEEQIERRIAKNPKDTANYLELAQWYSNLSDYAKAEECYERAAEVSSNAFNVVEGLLEIQKKRLHSEALRLKEEYEKKPHEESKSVFLEMRSRYEAKSLELALHRIKYYPSHAGYRYDYGVLLRKSGQIKEAIAEFQRAKADAPRAGDCLLELGQCFQIIKQYKLAMTHYQEAVSALEPCENRKKALYLAMKLALTLEEYAQAEEYGHQLAAIDFSYRDLGEMLELIAQQRNVHANERSRNLHTQNG